MSTVFASVAFFLTLQLLPGPQIQDAAFIITINTQTNLFSYHTHIIFLYNWTELAALTNYCPY